MEKLNLGYSQKNTPTPNEKTYKLTLTEKIKLFIKNLRWKAIVFMNDDSEA